MSKLMGMISKRLSLKLSLGITLSLAVMFILSLGVLFARSRQMVKQEALERVEIELENMTKRVDGMMNEVETAARTGEWNLTDDKLHPDSLLDYALSIVAMNPNFDGCSISMEPDYFPEKGHYYSVYAYRLKYNGKDTLMSKVESPYDYFDKVYYKTPIQLGHPSWVEAYAENNDGVTSASYEDLIVSYCVPLRNSKKEIVGVISTDLSMPWLAKTIQEYKPYKSSYSTMLGADGQYLIHPDTAKQMKQTIFSAADVRSQQDLIAFGHDMIAGNNGIMNVKIKGKACIAVYKSLKRAPWSFALICQESDIMAEYTKLHYVLIPVLVLGLLVIMLFSMKVITSMTQPLNELTEKLSYITNGHFDEPIETTKRHDVLGRLQNSFAEMQKALSEQIRSLQEVNVATEQTNKELAEASRKARRSLEKKNDFLKDITHQLRTPLNIINGFMQVLRDDYTAIPKEEVDSITDTMLANAISMARMVNMLLVASSSGRYKNIDLKQEVNISELINTVAEKWRTSPPHTIDLETSVMVDDTFFVKTNREYLQKILLELLYNAKKFATDGQAKLEVKAEGLKVTFTVEDTGPGISKDVQENLFGNFEKGDVFTEGLGMGLPVCRQMARMLGGDLKYDANYTNGSRFVLVIPNDKGAYGLR